MSESEPFLSKVEAKADEKEDKRVYETIQALFFMVAFSTSLGILGSASVFNKFAINSLLAEFFILIFVIVTYAINHHMMAYCCRLSKEDYNYAEYLEEKFGKIPAMLYDILMVIHNVVILAYIQQRITIAIFGESLAYDNSYYMLALINIPLIFISLTSEFKNVKWFCIVLMLTWIYVFTGAMVETTDTSYNPSILSDDGFGGWVVRLVGFQIYFASAFQSLPFIYREVKHEGTIKNVINISAIVSLVVYFTIYMYSSIPKEEYEQLRNYGIALIGACSIIVNIIPARFSLGQFLAGNDANNLSKSSTSDRMLSVILIMGSVVLSLFLVKDSIWDAVIGLGVVLSAFLGLVIPPLAILATPYYRELLSHGSIDKKIMVFGYLVWILILAVTGMVGGFYIMFDPLINYKEIDRS